MDKIIKNQYFKIRNYLKESKPEVVYLLGWTWPVLISNILNQVVYLLVNMASVGRIGENELAAVALGNTYTFATSSFIVGAFNSMDTFISQGYGAKNYKLIGATLQRALVVSFVLSIIVTILWIITEPLLLLIHQDQIVAELTTQYVWGMIPGLWFNNILTVLQKYLQGQGIMYPSIICGVVLNISNAIFNFILVHGLTSSGGIGVVGCGLSTSISKLAASLLLLLWIKKFELYRGTWFGFTKEELFGWPGLKEYLKLAIPAGAQMVFEGCAFEILTVLAGLFGAIELDGHSIAMNFTLLTFMLPFSISIALSVRIGQLLGEKNAQQAKKSMGVGFFITMSFMILISLFQFFSRHFIGKMYTNKPEVLELVASILPISALFQFFDGFQTTCQGVIRGTGKNNIGAAVNFGAFYLVGMPLSCVFAFAVHLKVEGLWYGLAMGLFAAAIVLGVVVFRIDWDHEVQVTVARTSTFENLNDIEMQNETDVNGAGNPINHEDDEFERFNRERSDEELGQAILNSTIKNNKVYSSINNSHEQEQEEEEEEFSINEKRSILSKDYVKINHDIDPERQINNDNDNDNDSDNNQTHNQNHNLQNININTVSIISNYSDNEEYDEIIVSDNQDDGSTSDIGNSAILN